MNSPTPPKPPDTSEADSAPEKPNSISELIGGSLTLPGESPALYRVSLEMLIAELEAKTILQVYLAEKIHDCLWWIRRYEEQKRATLIAEMALMTRKKFDAPLDAEQIHVREALMANKPDKRALLTIAAAGHTQESLRQAAFHSKRETIFQLDEQIALQTRILAGLQSSYEVAFSRKLNVERLAMQNEAMRRDLQAIEGGRGEQPKATRRKST